MSILRVHTSEKETVGTTIHHTSAYFSRSANSKKLCSIHLTKVLLHFNRNLLHALYYIYHDFTRYFCRHVRFRISFPPLLSIGFDRTKWRTNLFWIMRKKEKIYIHTHTRIYIYKTKIEEGLSKLRSVIFESRRGAIDSRNVLALSMMPSTMAALIGWNMRGPDYARAHVPLGIYRHLLPSTVVDNRTRDASLSVYVENW